MNLAGHHISTAALAPVLLFQGLNARRGALKLPEPAGERTGECGQGKSLRLLILGDSAAAGVGAAHQHAALSGQIAQELSEHFHVRWRLFARTGETTRSTLNRIQRLSSKKFDIAVTSLGVNDVTSGARVKRWLSLQSELRTRLRTDLGIQRIVVSSLPMMDRFPALPQPLRWHLGARARLFNQRLAEDLAVESDCTFLRIDAIENFDLMAEDGFHPGPKAYSIWGSLAADVIKRDCR
jgi:lysophospholipase L1-like esterase